MIKYLLLKAAVFLKTTGLYTCENESNYGWPLDKITASSLAILLQFIILIGLNDCIVSYRCEWLS